MKIIPTVITTLETSLCREDADYGFSSVDSTMDLTVTIRNGGFYSAAITTDRKEVVLHSRRELMWLRDALTQMNKAIEDMAGDKQ